MKYDHDKIEQIKNDWIDRQTEQVSDDYVREAVTKMAEKMKMEVPEILILPSPKAARDAVPGGSTYHSTWWRAWAGWYEGAKALGVEFDEGIYELFRQWAIACPVVVLGNGVTAVSRNPVDIHWDDGLLHNNSGMAVRYADGWGWYSIEGMRVDEQVVMRPETQTIYQIHKEENEEIRRIRIDRFGWMRYLEESGAEVLDYRRNDVECTRELLAQTPVGKRLITFCPSTGRRYALGIPDDEDVETCEQAQERLWDDRGFHWIGAT